MWMDIFDPQNYAFNTLAFFYGVAGTFILLLGIRVLFNDFRKGSHLAFFAVSITLSWWLIATVPGFSALLSTVSFFWHKVAWIGVILVPPSAYAFAAYLFDIPDKRRKVFFTYLVFLPFLFALPFNLVLSHVKELPWAFHPQAGFIEFVFIPLFFIVMVFVLLIHIRTLQDKTLSVLRRTQARLLTVAISVAYIGALDFLSNFDIQYYPIGFIPLLIWTAIMSYAILRYQLFRVTLEVAAPTIVETMPAYLFVVNDEGNIVITNETTSQICGVAQEQIVGKSVGVFLPDADQLIHLARALPREHDNAFLREQESFLRTKEREIPISMSASVIRDAAGAFVGFTVVCLDISRIKELNDLRNRFIRIVSHQLQTPLGVARWNMETLLSGGVGGLRVTQSELVRISHDAILEVIRRVSDMLMVMDIEEGRITLRRERVSLEGLLESLIKEFTSQFAVKNLTYVHEPPSKPLPSLMLDLEKMRVVLHHFLLNAVSYTAAGGRITTRFTEAHSALRFEIADTGIGIPHDEQSRIFTRFFRASNAPNMKPDASGIGLSIARFFVEQHGGHVGFTSEEGKGSTFWFELPIA